jgi:DNA-binding NtrC family response regulator
MEKTILVIDDDAAIRDVIRIILEPRGYTLMEATAGADGVELFRMHRPGLIITDIHMPGQNGLDVIRDIKKVDPAARVIAMSGAISGPDSVIKTAGSEFADLTWMEKPFRRSALLLAVEQALADR